MVHVVVLLCCGSCGSGGSCGSCGTCFLAIASHALEWFDHWNNHCRDWRFFVGVIVDGLRSVELTDTHVFVCFI